MPPLIRRTLFIFVAYLAAAIAAGIALGAASYIGGTVLPAVEGLVKIFIVGGLLFGPLVAILAAVPAALCILVAEYFRWRSLLLHLVPAAGIGAGLYTVTSQDAVFDRGTTLAFAAAGAVAGFVYWAIAGRKAGLRAREAA